MSYDAGAWHDFFVMLGGAAAALTGLVFVALSLHLDRLVANPFHRFRAGISVAGLTSILSGAALVPTQPHQAFGLEVLANAAFFLWLNVTASRPTLARVQVRVLAREPLGRGPRPGSSTASPTPPSTSSRASSSSSAMESASCFSRRRWRAR